MARIGSTLSGIERRLLNRLAESQAAVALSTLRMATGKDVNTPADNPSAFITLSNFQGRLSTVTATMSNVTAASSLISQAQTTLGDIRTQLNTIRTELAKDEDRALTPAQRAESQAKIDTAINAINALANSTIDGRRVLDGSADYLYSGRKATQVTEVTVSSMRPGTTRTISGSVTEAATQASLLHMGADGKTTASATFTLTGKLGSVELSVANEEDLDDVAERINDESHKTGIVASVDGNELTLTSVDYGTRATTQVAVSAGTFIVASGSTASDAGTDAAVEINGHIYDGSQVDGNRVAVNDNGLVYQIEFAPGFTGTLDPITISGTALTFALDPNLSHRTALAIPSLEADHLGGLSGTLDQLYSGEAYSGLDGNASRAIRIVDKALGELTRVEGSVDGFFNASVTSSSQLLAELQEDLATAITETDGYNEQAEEANLSYYEALTSNAIASLSILHDQRASIVGMIQHLAGLD